MKVSFSKKVDQTPRKKKRILHVIKPLLTEENVKHEVKKALMSRFKSASKDIGRKKRQEKLEPPVEALLPN